MLNTIRNRTASNQPIFTSMEGENKLLRNTLDQYIDEIIRENATYRSDGYILWAHKLDHAEQKIFLSYLISIEDYEECLTNKTLEIAYIKEHIDEMQYLIDQRIDNVWHEAMEEMGLVLCHHRDNGEPYYRQR